jgi:hypothetical protein
MAAVLAFHTGKPVVQIAALEIPRDHLLDIGPPESVLHVILDDAGRSRRIQIDALSGVLERYGVDPHEFPPAAVLLVLSSIPRFLVMEMVEAAGIEPAASAETLTSR